MAPLSPTPPPPAEPNDSGSIAVIGMAGRFPGAPNVAALWDNLRAGVESIRFFTDAELLAAGESPEQLRDPAYVRAQSQLADIDRFDATFFGMSAIDAAVFDPQHRVFLECAWAAFEDAGYVGDRIAGPVGVFASCGLSEYMIKNVLTNAEVKASVGEWLIRHTGNDASFLATRVSYELNLRGPSLSIQTACSSSLAALHVACQSLLNGESDLALAGGCTITPAQNRGYLFKEGEILSPDGHCRAFDASSSGTIFASACGAVILKRLEDARRDGDRILAVIRGSAINNDGRDKVGYLAPSVSGQARVVSEALAVAGVDPREVSYVEAHGSGTRVGDPIELAGLTQAFRQGTADKQFCAIGSLKTNIGHAGETAAIGGFIKTVLSLMHRELPPSLHYEAPNPHADFSNSPFFVNAALRPWTVEGGGPRIAGVTGLGAGGTNVHVIVEEAPQAQPSSASRDRQLLTLSAKTPAALEQATRELAEHLRTHPTLNLADVAFTELAGRKAFRHRRALACADREEAIAALAALDPLQVATGVAAEAPSLVLMFPGGGAQHVNMARGLYESEPVFRSVIDACARHLQPQLGVDLRTLIYPKGDLEAAAVRLQRPSVALPALFATEYALAKLLQSWGVTPAAMIGHSAGEYAAACLAGVISMEEALSLVALRGRLFETLPEGAMLTVSLGEAEARARLPAGLGIAAANAPGLCVVSGPSALIDALETSLTAEEIDCSRLHIDVAAHSAMLDPILEEFLAFCRTISFQAPKLPYVSNLTGTWITAAEATDPSYWVRHLRQTVRFSDGIQTLLSEGNRLLLEIGPGRTLSSLARQAQQKPAAVASSMRHPKEEGSDLAFLLAGLGRLWVAGLELDAARLFEGQRRARLSLPTYPFERQRYWIEPGKPTQESISTSGPLRKRADPSAWFYTPGWRRSPAPRAEAGPQTWLVIEGRKNPLIDRLVERLQADQQQVIRVAQGGDFLKRANGDYALNVGRKSNWEALAEALKQRGVAPTRIVHATSVDASARISPVEWISGEPVDHFGAAARDYAGLLFLIQAMASEGAALRLAVITSRVHAVLGGRRDGVEASSTLQEIFKARSKSGLVPERALLHGAARVIPREFPNLEAVAIDVDAPAAGSPAQARLVDRLVHELGCKPKDDVVAFRAGERWVRVFDPIQLEEPPVIQTQGPGWARAGGVYLITGGLGGIGLEVAEHLARGAKAKLVLLGRTPLPPDSECAQWVATHPTDDPVSLKLARITELRALGSEVMTACADVGDLTAMGELVAQIKHRFGAIHGVFHCAGVLKDGLIALRGPEPTSEVLHAKVKGTLVLDEVLAGEPLELFVLFSSVSSILGLPGQADYTAANAFLDAFAHKKSAEGETRAVVINWNGWQQIGMAASAVRAERATEPRHLIEEAHEEGEAVRFSTSFSRKRHWVLDEHVVRGGDAVMPGTGFVQLAAEAIDRGGEHRRSLELRDLFFLAPFVVQPTEARRLQVTLGRSSSEVAIFSDSEASPHATARASWIEPTPGVRHDLTAIRARCTEKTERFEGYSDQPFMDFGPRWGCLRRIDYGRGEAIATVELPEQFASEVKTHRLHPALLDMATGCAQALIPGFSSTQTFFVPFSYRRLVSRRALPAKVVSHIRCRESGAADLAVFDVTICDEAGDEVATVEGFTMRRIVDAAKLSNVERLRPARVSAAAPTESLLEATLREGILPAEGIAALDRILSTEVAPQIVASSIDLHAWLAQVDAAARPARSEPSAETPRHGPQFERPSLSTSFVAPASPLERELAVMWSDLLGVQQVGLHDDFFELGGQSLIAVRLFGRIRKKWGVELPLATLFSAPSVARCAAVLAEHLGPQPETAEVHALPLAPDSTRVASRPGFKSLVTIEPGGDRTPFFCVHGAGGNVLNFRDLSQLMDRAQPFYGLQARGIDGVLPVHRTIEEMASAYLEEVRAVQPHGPYLLGGYSGGGVVAFEMAQQLGAQGERVDLLAMIDTFHPQMPIRKMTMKRRLERLADGGVGYLKAAIDRRAEARHVGQAQAQIERLLLSGEPIPPELREQHLMRNFELAAAAYHPRQWKGRVMFFRAEQCAYIYLDAGPSYGWSEVIEGGLELVRVPGDHSNLLLGTNATIVAGTLSKALDEAQARLAPRRLPVSA